MPDHLTLYKLTVWLLPVAGTEKETSLNFTVNHIFIFSPQSEGSVQTGRNGEDFCEVSDQQK